MGLEEKLEEGLSEREIIEKIFRLLEKIRELEEKEKIKEKLNSIKKLLSLLPLEKRKTVLKEIFRILQGGTSLEGIPAPSLSPEAIQEIRNLRSIDREERSNLVDKLNVEPSELATPAEEEEESPLEEMESLYGEEVYEIQYGKSEEAMYLEAESAMKPTEGLEGTYETSVEETYEAREEGEEVPGAYEETRARKKEEEELGYLEEEGL